LTVAQLFIISAAYLLGKVHHYLYRTTAHTITQKYTKISSHSAKSYMFRPTLLATLLASTSGSSLNVG